MLEGQILSERYEVNRLIGGGGMANVYLGFDNILEREVAIKVLKIEYANDQEFISRFHREAQAATSLSHPNVVNIYDVGDEGDIYYMVMEYVEGMTLKEYIQRYGPISVEDSVAIMMQITSAIEHAHANHIVHRDIKPQNILIDTNRVAKVTDFGIALALTATSLTQTNSIIGSVHYLSPEQARGGMANRKSDIYALGLVLFEMLTGRMPFTGETAVSIAIKHLQTQTPSMRQWDPSIPQSLENIVLKSTAKDPFDRYRTVKELEDDLDTALNLDRFNEPPFVPQADTGEHTKAIPLLMSDQFNQAITNDETKIVNEATRPMNLNTQGPDESKKKPSRKKRVLLWTSIAFILFMIASLVALFVLPGMLKPTDVDLPDLRGEHVDDAKELLTALELEYEEKETYSDSIDKEYIVMTNPDVNTSVKVGTTVTLYVSQGVEPSEFSSFIGQSYNQVERMLLQQGYREVSRIDTYSDQPEGQIIGQEPAEGASIIPGETIPIFEVSIGERTIELENLEEMNETTARQYLTEKGLVANVTKEHSETVDEGRVIRHSPQAGESVEEGSIINLVVSLGEVELKPIQHTLSITVPYTGDQNVVESDQDDSEGENEDVENQEEETVPTAVAQEVRIYIEDMNNVLTDLYETDSITSDTEFTIRLLIEPNSTAIYKVQRDDQVILQKTIAYEDVKGD